MTTPYKLGFAMFTDNLEFLTLSHNLVASNREMSDMLDNLVIIAINGGLSEVPVPALLLTKIASLIRINAAMTSQLLEENEQISDSLQKLASKLTQE